MASVRIVEHSPFWVARIRAWVAMPDHPDGGFYRKTDRSTKVPVKKPRRAAQQAADELERIAGELRTHTVDKAFWESRLASLMRSAGVERPVSRTTFNAMAPQWLAAKKSLKPRSEERYLSDIAHFRRFLGVRAGHDLRTITPDDLSAFYEGLLAGGLSKTTAQHVTKSIRAIFERAHVLRLIESNPARLLRMEGGGESQRRPFTPEDIRAILDHIEAHEHKEWRTVVLFGLYYGMRIQDAANRRYEEIGDEAGQRVIRFVPRKKSNKGRAITLPLVGELVSIDAGTGLITPTIAARGKKISKDFGALLDRSPLVRTKIKPDAGGRSITDKTFHSFRHTVNSWMVDAGVDQRVRQLVCDHDDVRVSHRYTHAAVGTMAAAVQTVIDRLNPAKSPGKAGSPRGRKTGKAPAPRKPRQTAPGGGRAGSGKAKRPARSADRAP